MPAPGTTMPVAPIDEENQSRFREEKIGLTGQANWVQDPAADRGANENGACSNFGTAITLRLDRAHSRRLAGWDFFETAVRQFQPQCPFHNSCPPEREFWLVPRLGFLGFTDLADQRPTEDRREKWRDRVTNLAVLGAPRPAEREVGRKGLNQG